MARVRAGGGGGRQEWHDLNIVSSRAISVWIPARSVECRADELRMGGVVSEVRSWVPLRRFGLSQDNSAAVYAAATATPVPARLTTRARTSPWDSQRQASKAEEQATTVAGEGKAISMGRV